MLAMTREWVTKAEGDYDVVLLLLRSRKRSRLDAIAFHCQQCAEKYLKALLTEESVAFPKTHDLFELLKLLLSIEPGWSNLGSALSALSDHAVLPRYPRMHVQQEQVKRSVATCRSIRKRIRGRFGLK